MWIFKANINDFMSVIFVAFYFIASRRVGSNDIEQINLSRKSLDLIALLRMSIPLKFLRSCFVNSIEICFLQVMLKKGI